MEVTYNFANGENVIVLVDKRLGGAIMQLDKDLYNNNQKETRRHQSLSKLFDKTSMLVDENVNIEDDFLRRSNVDKLYEAISKLTPSEQELIHKLYLSKDPMTQIEFSKEKNISVGNLKMRLKRIKLKLKNLM